MKVSAAERDRRIDRRLASERRATPPGLDVVCLVCARRCDLILGIHVEAFRDRGHRAFGVIEWSGFLPEHSDYTRNTDYVAAAFLGPGNTTTLRYSFGHAHLGRHRGSVLDV